MPRRPLICFFLWTHSYGGHRHCALCLARLRGAQCTLCAAFCRRSVVGDVHSIFVVEAASPPRRRVARPRFFPGVLLIPGPRHSSLPLLVPSLLHPVFVI
ncbi:hypothetical protein B0H16DRAFT_1553725, partial [Mycena metata]